MLRPRPDPRLLNVWSDLRAFSAAANVATETEVKMPRGMFMQFTSSTPPRLTNLDFDPESISELLRLCMLAFFKGVVTPIEGLGKHLVFLSSRFKTALRAQQFAGSDMDKLLLWSLFVAALGVFEDFDRDWIRVMMVQRASSLNLQDWDETRNILKTFLWIDFVYDEPGRQLFNDWLSSSALQTQKLESFLESELLHC